jgi:hypothetical protein
VEYPLKLKQSAHKYRPTSITEKDLDKILRNIGINKYKYKNFSYGSDMFNTYEYTIQTLFKDHLLKSEFYDI